MPYKLSRFHRPFGKSPGKNCSLDGEYSMSYKLSPSSINLFLECPRCFWLQLVKKITRPQGAFPSLPSGMDRILKQHSIPTWRKENCPPRSRRTESKMDTNYSRTRKHSTCGGATSRESNTRTTLRAYYCAGPWTTS